MKNEQNLKWKDINGYEGAYSISNYGRVRINWWKHYSYFRGGTAIINKPKICKGTFFKGYRITSLCKDGKETKRLNHTLVAEHFIPNPNNYDTVDHISMVKTDNRVDNLRWTTRSQNTVWAQDTGVLGNLYKPKFNREQVLDIFNDKRSLDELADIYKVHRTTIHLIRVGKNYSRFTGKKYEKKRNYVRH